MAVAHDASASGGSNVVTVASGLTIPITIGSGANRYVRVCAVIFRGGAPAPSLTATFNGVAMSEIITFGTGGNFPLYMWGAIAPASGSRDVVITPDDDDAHISAGTSSYTGVNQTTPIGDTGSDSGTSTTPSLTMSPTSSGDMVIDMVNCEVVISGADGGQTVRWNQDSGSSEYCAGSDKPGTGSAVTMGWTLASSFNWGMVGAVLQQTGGTYGVAF